MSCHKIDDLYWVEECEKLISCDKREEAYKLFYDIVRAGKLSMRGALMFLNGLPSLVSFIDDSLKTSKMSSVQGNKTGPLEHLELLEERLDATAASMLAEVFTFEPQDGSDVVDREFNLDEFEELLDDDISIEIESDDDVRLSR